MSILSFILFTLAGKPMPPHLLCCQGFAVNDHSFALGRLVVAKRKSRRRGSCGILDFRSFEVLGDYPEKWLADEKSPGQDLMGFTRSLDHFVIQAD